MCTRLCRIFRNKEIDPPLVCAGWMLFPTTGTAAAFYTVAHAYRHQGYMSPEGEPTAHGFFSILAYLSTLSAVISLVLIILRIRKHFYRTLPSVCFTRREHEQHRRAEVLNNPNLAELDNLNEPGVLDEPDTPPPPNPHLHRPQIPQEPQPDPIPLNPSALDAATAGRSSASVEV